MPVFEIQQPDGSVYEVEAPDLETAAKPFDQQPAPQMGTGEDMLRSGASGIARGAAYMAGTLGDLRDFGAKTAGWAAGKLGASPETAGMVTKAAQYATPLGFLPNSEQLTQGAEQAGIKFHQPQTRAGKYAETIGEFVPAAVGGPGGVLRKAATAIIPGAASEAAGQAVEGTPFEPYARIAGAVAASPIAGVKEAARSTGPTREQLRMTARRSESLADQMGVAIKPEAVNKLIDKVLTKAGNRGYFEANMPELKNSLAELERWRDSAPTLSTIRSLRENLQTAWQPGKRKQNRVLSKAIEKFDQVVDTFKQQDLVSGDPRAFDLVRMARAQWHKVFKADDIAAVHKAAERYAANYNNAGLETGLRQKYRQFLDNKRKTRGFNEAEKAAMERVVRGTPGGNLARYLGKFAPSSPAAMFLGSGVGGAVGGGVGYMVGGPEGAAIGTGVGSGLVGGTGTLAKALATRSTRRNAALVDEMVRRGSKSVIRRDDPASRRLVQALLSSRPSIEQLPAGDR